MKFETILESIGKTPLVKFQRIGSHLDCNLYGKCEFLNPGGSVKDRIGYRMVIDAEKQGRIKPGDTLIEPTSGNTGIGLALAAAIKGYRVIITMPEKMSKEKQVILEALGAEIIRTPTEAAWDSPESHISIAKRLQKELPNAHILDQYSNPSNPQVHYEETAQEIIDDLDGKVDMVVIGAGTGGTITGVAKRLKEHNKKVITVGADPIGSILGGGTHIAPYKVEGIGYDFIPDVLDRKLVDRWIKTNDRESFILARQLIKEEGLLVGGSSGSALAAALQAAKELPEGANCVVLLPDGVRNYMTKFIDDKWMRDNRFIGPESVEGTVADILKEKTHKRLITIDYSDTAKHAIEIMKSNGISQLPVIRDEAIVGILTESDLLNSLSTKASANQTRVHSIMNRSVPTVEESTPLDALLRILINVNAGRAIVIDEKRQPKFILTKIDVLEWMGK